MANGPPAASAAGRACAVAGGLLFVGSLAYAVFSYTRVYGRPSSSPAIGWPALADACLFSVFAAHHSAFARTGLKNRIARAVSPALERSVYVWIASALFIVVCAAWRPVAGAVWRASGPAAVALGAAQLLGVWITYVSSRQLDVLSLAGVRQAFGSAKPHSTGLVETHWYRLVRHPIYFGWVLMVWPTPHMTGTRLAFAAISTAYLALAIPFEERSLTRDFGDDYRSYTRRVRWRMVPFLY
jgi:protein-S-isoprenylcysteine O-methyltransferase Ste14